jgi:hypothetical protein
MGGKGGRCVQLTTLPPSCADCHEIWEPQPPGTLRASPEVALLLPFIFYVAPTCFSIIVWPYSGS